MATRLQDENMLLMKRIREWRKNTNKIASLMSMTKRLDGVETKPLSENLEESITDCIILRRLKGLRVSKASYEKSTIDILKNGTHGRQT